MPSLQAVGGKVVAFNPESMGKAGHLLKDVLFSRTAYEAAYGANVLVVITEWHEFRGLDPRRLKEVMRRPRIVDLRNIFDPEEMRAMGFTYESIGRGGTR